MPQVLPSVAVLWLLRFFEEYDNKPEADRQPLYMGYIFAALLPIIFVSRSGFENQCAWGGGGLRRRDASRGVSAVAAAAHRCPALLTRDGVQTSTASCELACR